MWTKDNTSIFYVTKDDLDRPYKVGEVSESTATMNTQPKILCKTEGTL